MNEYNDLESAILSCLLLKPDLMKDMKLEDKHFKHNYKIWAFMKSFYKKFGNFDITLMATVCKSKYKMFQFISYLLELEPAPNMFYRYEERLLELYNQKYSEKVIVKNVFDLANELYVGNITVDEFKNKIDNLYANANKLDGGD